MVTPTQSIDCLKARGIITPEMADELNMRIVSAPRTSIDILKGIVGFAATGGGAPPVVLPPVFSVQPTITGAAVEGSTLTANPGTANAPIVGQWHLGGVATGISTLTIVAGIGSYTWASTATNSAGPTVATSNAIVTVSMFDVDAAAYFNRAEALGGSFDLSTINAAYTATYIKNSINNLIAGIKADGNWPLVKEFYLFSGVTFAGLMAKVKYTTTPALTNNGFTVANFIAAGSGAGLVGNASNYLSGTMTDTALGPVGGVGIFQTVIDTATNFALFGSQGTGGGLATDEYSIQKFTLERSCYGGIVNQFTNSLIDLGAHTICRQSNTSLKKVVNATTVMTDTTAITVTSRSQEFYIFRRNGASPNPTVARLSCAWLLSGAHTEVNVQAIHARVRTLMTAFGVA